MTVTRARQILGAKAIPLTDEQIQSIIDGFDKIIEIGFSQFEIYLNELNKNKYEKETLKQTQC